MISLWRSSPSSLAESELIITLSIIEKKKALRLLFLNRKRLWELTAGFEFPYSVELELKEFVYSLQND